MSLKKGQHIGGIRTTDDVRQRCFIDADGCWIWRGSMSDGSPNANIEGRCWKVRRWTFLQASNAPAPAGTWHTGCRCAKKACVSPHCALPLPPKQFARWLRDSGYHHTPAHKARHAEAMRRIAPKLNPQKALDCARRVLGGEPAAAVAATLGISRGYAYKVAAGQAWSTYTRSLRP